MDEKLGPLDHVARPPLPWRTTTDLTECGKQLARIDPGRIITPDELQRRVARIGQQRAAFTTCMTCWDTARRHESADADPIHTLRREVDSLRYASLPARREVYRSGREHDRAVWDWERRELLQLELEALAALVDAHRDEFDGYLQGRREAVDLTAARRQRRRPS